MVLVAIIVVMGKDEVRRKIVFEGLENSLYLIAFPGQIGVLKSVYLDIGLFSASGEQGS